MMRMMITAGLAAALIAGWSCGSSPDANRKAIEEQSRLFVQAMNEEHVDGLMAIHWNSPDLIALYPDGNYRGYDTVKQRWWNLFNTMDIKKFEFTENHPVAAGDIVYEWGLYAMSYQFRGGPIVDAPGRFLVVWEKKDKRWVITAEHFSVPVPLPSSTSLAAAEIASRKQ